MPATRRPRSRDTSSLSLSDSGTSPWAIRMARPSTIAVLPTPASPMRIGLFFVLRERIWMIRLISMSLPMTGSSLFSDAIFVRLFVYFASAFVFFGVEATSPFAERISSMTRTTDVRSILNFARSSRAGDGTSKSATKRCSVEMNSSFIDAATFDDASIAWASSGVR